MGQSVASSSSCAFLTLGKPIPFQKKSFNFTPAHNARSVIMVAQYQDREYKSLLPPLVINPLDPKLPT